MQPASDVMRVQLILQGAGKYRLHKLTGRNCCVDAVFVIYLFIYYSFYKPAGFFSLSCDLYLYAICGK